jgi:hypothetical protein
LGWECNCVRVRVYTNQMKTDTICTSSALFAPHVMFLWQAESLFQKNTELHVLIVSYRRTVYRNKKCKKVKFSKTMVSLFLEL